jgi:hypothetical protein
MFSPLFHRCTSLGLLLVYLTAGSLGGLLHEHHGAELCHERMAGAGHDHGDHDHAGCGHADQDVAEPALAGVRAAHHDDCTICRFLGQRSLAVTVAAPAGLCQLCVELTPLQASQPFSSLALTTHSRAPPLAGWPLAGMFAERIDGR